MKVMIERDASPLLLPGRLENRRVLSLIKPSFPDMYRIPASPPQDLGGSRS